MKVNCSRGYSDVQKEKLSKCEESYVLGKTVWETLPAPSAEVLRSSPNCCWPWDNHSAGSPSPGFCLCSCLWCPCLRWGVLHAGCVQAGAGGSTGPSGSCLLARFAWVLPERFPLLGWQRACGAGCRVPWQDRAGGGCWGPFMPGSAAWWQN